MAENDNSNVLMFTGDTRVELPVEQVLDEAKGELAHGAVIIGWTEGDALYFSSSTADKAEILWLLEQTKQSLIAGEFNE